MTSPIQNPTHRTPWHASPAALAALTFVLILFLGPPAWAGPYVRTSVELSVARSTKECQGQAAKTMSDLRKEGRLRVSENNPRVGSTRDTTAYVECIYVGKNESKRDQWIYYISIASTDRKESVAILNLLRDRLGRSVRID